MQKGLLSLATSSATSRRPPGAESIPLLSPDRGEIERLRPCCPDREWTEEGWRPPFPPPNEVSVETSRWGPLRMSLLASRDTTLPWCCPKTLLLHGRTEGPEMRENLSEPPASPCGWQRERLRPATRDLRRTDRQQWHPTRSEASDQSRRSERYPPRDDHSAHHHRRSSREGKSQGTKTELSRKSQPHLRANCRALIWSQPPGTRCAKDARWPNRTLQNLADCTFEDRNSSAIEKNLSILKGVCEARKVCDSILIPK